MNKILCGLIGLLLLGGCATYQPSQKIWLTPKDQIVLPAKNCAKDFEKDQLLTIKYKGEIKRAVVSLSCSGDHLSIIAMMPSGPRIFTLSRSKENIQLTKHISLPEGINPEQILWNVLFAYLSPEDLRKSLPQGFTLKDSSDERDLFSSEGELVLQARFNNSKLLEINCPSFRYSIEIKEL